MRESYLLYPSALEKIKLSGIEKRVSNLISKDELPYLGGHTYFGHIISSVQSLKEEGYYEHIPEDFAPIYKKTMNEMLNSPKDFFWTIQKGDNTIKEPCDISDMLLFTGDIASFVLNPTEIWDYKKFGFTSPSEFITTVGAYLIEQSKGEELEEGYNWTTKREDGSEIVTEITGDSNFDLRVFQRDITPYQIIDPFGNSIEMRPKTDSDVSIIAPYHSTEPDMLVAVMKYIEQQNIQTQYQKDNAKELIRWGHSQGNISAGCAEHYGGFDKDPISFFIGYNIPIPQLDILNKTSKYTNYNIFTSERGSYETYIANNGDFILSHRSENEERTLTKPISARFLPQDAEHIVKGLIYQCAKNLGRTSVKQLTDILKYRYSSQFEKDQEEYKIDIE